MTGFLNKEFSRKSFLKGGGALIVGFSLGGAGLAGKARAAAPTADGLQPRRSTKLDSWLSINADNTVNVKRASASSGNGISTGFLMVAAEELDMPMSQMLYGTATTTKGQQINTIIDAGSWSTGGNGGSNAMSSRPRIRAAGAPIVPTCSSWPPRSSASRSGA